MNRPATPHNTTQFIRDNFSYYRRNVKTPTLSSSQGGRGSSWSQSSRCMSPDSLIREQKSTNRLNIEVGASMAGKYLLLINLGLVSSDMFDDLNPNECSKNEDSSQEQYSMAPSSAPQSVIMSPMILRPSDQLPTSSHVITQLDFMPEEKL